MKVTGFTFVRNAIKFDYPVVEAITSILPICDHLVILVGNSDDETLPLIQSIGADNIQLVESVWDDSLRVKGRVLSAETNKALKYIPKDSDWCFYIQADEVVHEKYLHTIKTAMQQWKDDPKVDGLLFNYHHFYGSYDYIANSSNWYRKEIRVIKNNPSIYSYRDAQGFRKGNAQKLRVKPIDAYINHYGWVKPPEKMQRKVKNLHSLWHDDQWIEENIQPGSSFDYSAIDSLKCFEGSHPKVMQKRINKKNWKFDFDISKDKSSLKEKVRKTIEAWTGYRIGEYKNYTII